MVIFHGKMLVHQRVSSFFPIKMAPESRPRTTRTRPNLVSHWQSSFLTRQSQEIKTSLSLARSARLIPLIFPRYIDRSIYIYLFFKNYLLFIYLFIFHNMDILCEPQNFYIQYIPHVTRVGSEPCVGQCRTPCLFKFSIWCHAKSVSDGRNIWFLIIWFNELDDGKIYRKALYLMIKSMVSCKFSLKP